MDTLKLKKAWELAIAPAKQLPMNAIGMYMTGNSLQIFSIMMVFMLFKAPVQAIMNIQNTFSRLETDGNRSQMLMVKAAFVACNCLALALGIWKVNGMGLLPYVERCECFFFVADLLLQDDEIRLACLGDSKRAVTESILCAFVVRQHEDRMVANDYPETFLLSQSHPAGPQWPGILPLVLRLAGVRASQHIGARLPLSPLLGGQSAL